MSVIRFSNLLLPEGWSGELTMILDQEGKIVSKSKEAIPYDTLISGPALPGFINAHSHAFQYAMAGLSETISKHRDDFWSWRELMYSIAEKINPDQLEAIAAMLYSEMLRNGYTHVVEFHYLHHLRKGIPYSSLSEMGERLLRAADIAGIGITLVPIFYQKGGFGVPPANRQERFISASFERYDELVQHTKVVADNYINASMGYGVHSLRAVAPNDVITAFNAYNSQGPFHLHISEQPQEVADCLAFHGKRPVDWLFDQLPVNENTHLVHSTHISPEELGKITRSGAHVVLCPTTEGNLGDGTFPFSHFINTSGKFSIGSDSHIGLNPAEELRWLDYQQRLLSNKRRPFDAVGSIGDRLVGMAQKGGAAAAGIRQDFDIGDTLNILELDENHPLIGSTKQENLLNTFLYSGDSSMIKNVITRGNVVVTHGNKVGHEKIAKDFTETISALGIR